MHALHHAPVMALMNWKIEKSRKLIQILGIVVAIGDEARIEIRERSKSKRGNEHTHDTSKTCQEIGVDH